MKTIPLGTREIRTPGLELPIRKGEILRVRIPRAGTLEYHVTRLVRIPDLESKRREDREGSLVVEAKVMYKTPTTNKFRIDQRGDRW